ncbi:MAG: type II secretion system protein M [Planctomycetes bacterium]|nr:type II secretion system protein M [Planctomycetota bacterium]
MRLTQREKLFTVASIIFIAVWGLFAFAVSPAIERTETLRRVIPEKQSELETFRTKASEYIALRDGLDTLHTKIASQEKIFELLPFLESLIRECGLAKNVATMKQQVSQLESNHCETIVEIELQNLTLSQLVNFLWQVESSKVLARTKNLYIKKNLANTDLLDSLIEVHNLKLARN